MRLATTLHPYYQESWLSKQQAQALLQTHGITGGHVTAAWCKSNSIEVASTGHIRLISLTHYIERVHADEAQRELDETGTHAPDCRCDWCEPGV